MGRTIVKLCPACEGKGFKEVEARNSAGQKLGYKKIPCKTCKASGAIYVKQR